MGYCKKHNTNYGLDWCPGCLNDEMESKTDTSYGCDDCRMLKGKYCKLWQVKVADPHNSHCESFQLVKATTPSKGN